MIQTCIFIRIERKSHILICPIIKKNVLCFFFPIGVEMTFLVEIPPLSSFSTLLENIRCYDSQYLPLKSYLPQIPPTILRSSSISPFLFSSYSLIFHTTVYLFLFFISIRLKFPTFSSLHSHLFYSTNFSFRNLLFDEFSFCICACVLSPYLIKQNVQFYFFHTIIFLILRV